MGSLAMGSWGLWPWVSGFGAWCLWPWVSGFGVDQREIKEREREREREREQWVERGIKLML